VHPASRPFPSSFLRYEHCREPYARTKPPHGVQLGTRHPTTRTNVPSAKKRWRNFQGLQSERKGCVSRSQQVLRQRALALKQIKNGLHHVGRYPDRKARIIQYKYRKADSIVLVSICGRLLRSTFQYISNFIPTVSPGDLPSYRQWREITVALRAMPGSRFAGGGRAAGNARQPFRWGGRRCGKCQAAILRGAAALAVSPERVVADFQLLYFHATLHEWRESKHQHVVHTLHNYSLPIRGLH